MNIRYLLAALFFMCTMSSIVSKDRAALLKTRLSVIYFRFNSTEYADSLTSQRYYNEYAAMKELMAANPEIDLEIHGYQNTKEHTNLSLKRAQKVKQDLMHAGVSENRMILKQEALISVTDTISDTDKALTQKVVFTVAKQTK